MKFRVALEASAAIGIEMEIEADNEDDAIRIAEGKLENRNFQRTLTDIVDELMIPDPLAVEAYAEKAELPMTYAMVEVDENGFEAVDAFLPEIIKDSAA